MKIELPIEAMGKPRMTQRDKWAKRDCVVKYYEWSDAFRALVEGSGITNECLKNVNHVSWTAYFSMPKSWSEKKKLSMKGKLHLSKPDRDNIDKAILDTLFNSDSAIADGIICKRWDDGKGPRIELELKIME